MATMFEIVEMENGVVALRKVNSDGEPLVKIQFSCDAMEHFPKEHLEIAKAMIEAGVLKVGELTGIDIESHSESGQSSSSRSRLLH